MIERPYPNEADLANARTFFDELAAAHGHPRVGAWSQRERSNGIRRLADLEMAKRMEAEFRQRAVDEAAKKERRAA